MTGILHECEARGATLGLRATPLAAPTREDLPVNEAAWEYAITMTESTIMAFHESFDRCMASGRFFDVFYDHFLASSPEVAAKFRGTDFGRQKQMLKMSLYVMVSAVVLRNTDYRELSKTARRHAKTELDIPPRLYAFWLDSLIFAARTCDRAFDSQTEANWREAMQPGIDYLISFY